MPPASPDVVLVLRRCIHWQFLLKVHLSWRIHFCKSFHQEWPLLPSTALLPLMRMKFRNEKMWVDSFNDFRFFVSERMRRPRWATHHSCAQRDILFVHARANAHIASNPNNIWSHCPSAVRTSLCSVDLALFRTLISLLKT